MENLLNNYNYVTPLLLAFLILPLFIGLVTKLSKTSIWIMLISLLRTIAFIASIITSVYITKLLFFDYKIPAFMKIKDALISSFPVTLNPDTIIYLVSVPVLVALTTLLLRLILMKVEYKLFDKLSTWLHDTYISLWAPVRIMIKILMQLPRAVINTLLVTLLLTIYSMYLPSPNISDQLDQSRLYKLINRCSIEPLMSSSYAQKIPVLFNQSLSEIDQSRFMSEYSDGQELPQKLANGTKIVWYFNGVTLDDAIKSNAEIDSFAVSLVQQHSEDRKKARAIYRWISSNIKYDYVKAEKISENMGDASSGAIMAFDTRKGICFDTSSLYVAMCRAAGLKVRLIVGMGFNGITWGEHSWNQVYIPEENKWINVDTTFAMGGNYFDRVNFDVDHRMAKIAGEW